MSVCESAELKAQEYGVKLTPSVRSKLSEFNDKEQVGFIVNPLVQRILINIKQDILSSFGSFPTVSTTQSSNNVVEIQSDKSPKKNVKEVVEEDSDDEYGGGLSLFD